MITQVILNMQMLFRPVVSCCNSLHNLYNTFWKSDFVTCMYSGIPRNFVWGEGGQQIQLRTEDRENGDLGAVAP